MNLLETVCKELGVEIGEAWNVEWTTDNKYTNYTKFKITKTGMMGYREDYGSWFAADSFLPDLIQGRLKPVWKPKEGELYYYPYVVNSEKERFNASYWEDTAIDKWLFENNLAFRTAEEAIETTNKMLKALKEEK